MSDVSMMVSRVSADVYNRQGGGSPASDSLALSDPASRWECALASEPASASGPALSAGALDGEQQRVHRIPAFALPKIQNVARPLTAEEKQALDEYVGQGKPSEQRAQAAERITRFIEGNGSALMLNGLGLTQLPDIVKTLRLDTLDVSHNKLAELPLPAQITFLHVSRNALTAMPVLPEGTRMVFAADNRIREFRGPLPDTLSHVYAPNNMLDALPPFPASIAQFDIEGNTGKLTQADVDAKICRPADRASTLVPV